jgi:hypothetical protein
MPSSAKLGVADNDEERSIAVLLASAFEPDMVGKSVTASLADSSPSRASLTAASCASCGMLTAASLGPLPIGAEDAVCSHERGSHAGSNHASCNIGEGIYVDPAG